MIVSCKRGPDCVGANRVVPREQLSPAPMLGRAFFVASRRLPAFAGMTERLLWQGRFGITYRFPRLPGIMGGAALEAKKLKGAEIMCESLIREGVEVLFGHPGGAILPFLRRAVGLPAIAAHPGAPRAGRGSRCRRIFAGQRQSGGVRRHLRPRSDQSGNRHHGSKGRLGSPHRHHRPGGSDRSGFRGIPGMRHLLDNLHLHQEEHHGDVGQ